jgi:hypothetical protein
MIENMSTDHPKVAIVSSTEYSGSVLTMILEADMISYSTAASIDEVDGDILAIILYEDATKDARFLSLRDIFPQTFIIIFQPLAFENPNFRLKCFEAGANMVAYDEVSILTCLKSVVLNPEGGQYACPYCGANNLSAIDLWRHCPLYHINWPNDSNVVNRCPICKERTSNMQVHIHEVHGPHTEVNNHKVKQLYNFSLVVCRHPTTGKYLLCQVR